MHVDVGRHKIQFVYRTKEAQISRKKNQTKLDFEIQKHSFQWLKLPKFEDGFGLQIPLCIKTFHDLNIIIEGFPNEIDILGFWIFFSL